MEDVLFVSKPVAPPWNDSSKNLVRDIAGNLQRHSAVVMGRRGQENPLDRGSVVPVYGAAGSSGFAPSARENLGVLRHLLLGRSAGIWHFFFAPNPKSSMAGRFAKTIRRTPCVHTVCSVPAPGASLGSVLFADVTVALSRAAYQRFAEAGISESSLRLIPPSVPVLPEANLEQREELRTKHGLPGSAAIWIYPGDLEFGNGARVTLEAFASWNRPDAVLLMACRRKTAEAEQIQAALLEQTKRWGIDKQVRWLGETRQIHEFLALSDYVLMVNDTAYAKMDYPLVALEAMCLGRPVLLARGTPSAELADTGGAIAVESDGEALAEAIEGLSGDEALRCEVSRRGRDLVTSKFSPAAVASAYELVYEELHG